MKMQKQHIYIASNPSMPGLIKLGRSKDPVRRIIDLSKKTEVPTPFVAEVVIAVQSKIYTDKNGWLQNASEIAAHKALGEYRVNERREFFKIEAAAAVNKILPVIGEYRILHAKDAELEFQLGEIYLEGEYVSMDLGQAMKWYRKAAEQGHKAAEFALRIPGRIATKYAGWKELTDAQLEDMIPADWRYADWLCWLRDGCKIMLDMRRWANDGSVYDQCRLGDMYWGGWIFTRNRAKAMRWYKKAADQGHAGAQYQVGNGYAWFGGCYVPHEMAVAEEQREAEAEKWYRKAAEQGHEGARDILERIYNPRKVKTKDAKVDASPHGLLDSGPVLIDAVR